MRRQQAERAPERLEPERWSQRDPARAQRAMRVHDAFGIARRARGEQDQRVVVELEQRMARPLRRLLDLARQRFPGADDRRSPSPSSSGTTSADGASIHNENRGSATDARLPISNGVNRLSTGTTQPPRSQIAKEIGEELQAVAVVEEDDVAGPQAQMGIRRDSSADIRLNVTRIPPPARSGSIANPTP